MTLSTFDITMSRRPATMVGVARGSAAGTNWDSVTTVTKTGRMELWIVDGSV